MNDFQHTTTSFMSNEVGIVQLFVVLSLGHSVHIAASKFLATYQI